MFYGLFGAHSASAVTLGTGKCVCKEDLELGIMLPNPKEKVRCGLCMTGKSDVFHEP